VIESLYRTVILVVSRVELMLAVPAVGSTVWTYFAYAMMVEPLGWGLKGRFIALVGAIMAGVLYWLGGWMLIKLVPRFSWLGRLLAMPAILAFMVLVVASSSYPQVMLFHDPAREAETGAYVGDVAAFTDGVKIGVEKAKGLAPLLDDIAGRIERLAELELRGVFSGVSSAGTVHATLKALAADVRQSRGAVEAGGSESDGLVARLDMTLVNMRAATKDSALEFEARRLKFEAEADGVRSVSIALGQAIPLMAMDALARRLQSELIKPAATGKADTRAKQIEALGKIETELRTIGKDLETRVADVSASLQKTPPIYEPLSVGELIVAYWHVLIQAWAISLSIDLFIVVLLWLACVAHDEAARQSRLPDARPAWALDAEQALLAARDFESILARPGQPLGPHPYPNATAIRAASRRGRGGGEGSGSTGGNGDAS